MVVKSKTTFQNRFLAYFKRMGYLRFGEFAERLIRNQNFSLVDFEKLKKQMRQAGWETSLRGYIGTTIFISIISAVLGLVVFGVLSIFVLVLENNELNSIAMLLFGIICAVIIGVLIFYGFVLYPSIKIKDRAIMIDAALPTVCSYMSAMTAAGVPPAPIFASLAKEKISPIITKEADRINRDIEILGLDVLRALEMAAYRSPSEKWSGFLEGMVGTVNAGGDLTQYLATETKAFMKYKQEKTKEYIENLGVIGEIFMVLGVVTPLFFVVMIAIISIISSAGQVSVVLLFAITYLIIPILMLVQLLITSIGDTEQEG